MQSPHRAALGVEVTGVRYMRDSVSSIGYGPELRGGSLLFSHVPSGQMQRHGKIQAIKAAMKLYTSLVENNVKVRAPSTKMIANALPCSRRCRYDSGYS